MDSIVLLLTLSASIPLSNASEQLSLHYIDSANFHIHVNRKKEDTESLQFNVFPSGDSLIFIDHINSVYAYNRQPTASYSDLESNMYYHHNRTNFITIDSVTLSREIGPDGIVVFTNNYFCKGARNDNRLITPIVYSKRLLVFPGIPQGVIPQLEEIFHFEHIMESVTTNYTNNTTGKPVLGLLIESTFWRNADFVDNQVTSPIPGYKKATIFVEPIEVEFSKNNNEVLGCFKNDTFDINDYTIVKKSYFMKKY